MSDAHVLVVGGGVAGVTAALDCAASGAEVTLVDVRRRLGGAAYSFVREGLHMDNGQHVFLRCCGAYRGLLARIGSEELTTVQRRLEIPVLRPGARPVTLRRGALPAPLQLAPALARYRHLTPLRRLRAARAAVALARLDAPALAREPTFGQWLAEHGQDEQATGALWDLIALPALNVRAAEASLSLAAFVFQTGLLSSAGAGDIGFHDAPLGETIGDAAQRALARAGVRVRLGWRAEALVRGARALEVSGRGGAGREDERDAHAADAVILAVPHARAASLLAEPLPQLAGRVARIGTSPIVNLHVLYDRRVFDGRFAAGVDTPLQYIFDRTEAAGAPAGTQYLAISLSGADEEMAMGVPALRRRYEPALRELLPRSRSAQLELFLATREHAATFRAAPGVGALRPGAATGLPGLFLAGAWTATGWPATLEGAVLSGHRAARAALSHIGERNAQAQRGARAGSGPAGAPGVGRSGGEPAASAAGEGAR